MRFVSFAFFFGLIVGATTVSAQYFPVTPETIVCRAGECQTAGMLEPDLLSEQLHLMFKTNQGQKVSLCNGVQSCVDGGLFVPVQVLGSGRVLTIPRATLVDAGQVDSSKINLILAYETYLNNFMPACQSAASRLDMTQPGQIGLLSDGYACALTAGRVALVYLNLALDYIDLENAVLGGSYTLTVNGAAVGQTAGHALIRLAKKTPVTLDEKSIGLRQPDKVALLEKARAEAQIKQQQHVFEEMRAEQPDDAVLQQVLMQTGGRDGIYPVIEMQPVMQPVVYETPVAPGYAMPEVMYLQ